MHTTFEQLPDKLQKLDKEKEEALMNRRGEIG